MFGGQNTFLGRNFFCFYCIFKTIRSRHNKHCAGYAPRGCGPQGSPDDQRLTKGIVRNDETVSTFSTLLSNSLECHEIFRCYAMKCDQNSNYCYFLSLCICLSRCRIFANLFDIQQFVLSQNSHHLYKHFEDGRWIAKLAYVADIFEQVK